MKRVGVRELRQNLGVYLRRVERGEALQVTERGRPVAVLRPVDPRDDGLARLEARGLRVRRGSGNLADLPARTPLAGGPRLSDVPAEGSRGRHVIYVDTSALVKLVVDEPETASLRRWFGSRPGQFSSCVAEIELVRAARRGAPHLETSARAVLDRLATVEVGAAIRTRAALLEPVGVRPLDAIHLATPSRQATLSRRW